MTNEKKFYYGRLFFTGIYLLVVPIIILRTSYKEIVYNSPYGDFKDLYRLLWCICWGSVGLGWRGYKLRKYQSSPWPAYVRDYPFYLLMNSLVIFSLFQAIPYTNNYLFYTCTLPFCLYFGFLIDWIMSTLGEMCKRIISKLG